MSVKSFVLNLGLKAKKHAPTLLVVGGVTTMAVGTVFACKATTKFKDRVYQPGKDEIDQIHYVRNSVDISEYTKKDYASDLCKAWIKTGGRAIKLYAVPTLIFTGGAAMVLKGHSMMAARNAMIAAAYKALEKHFSDYRGTVKELYGEGVENDIFRGIKTEHEVVEEVDDNGKKTTHVETFRSAPEDGTPCSFWYDENGFCNVDVSHQFNSDFINSAIRQCVRDFQLTKRKSTLADLMKYLAAKEGTIPPWAYTFGRMYPDANSNEISTLDISAEPMYKRDAMGNVDHEKRYFYITVNGYHDISNEMYASKWKKTEEGGIELNA